MASMTPNSLLALLSCTRFEVGLVSIELIPVRYVQTGTKLEQILQAIRDTIHSGVEFAEDKLGQVLDLLTSSKLTAEEKYEKAKASISSVYEVAITSASNYANTAAASATSAASAASASAS
jgi:hypothetical protein